MQQQLCEPWPKQPSSLQQSMGRLRFGCLGSSAITNYSSSSPLKRRGELPEGFLEAGVAPHRVKICQFSILKYIQ